ncbi:MAG: TraX family protein [Tissierellia bacterium]|nr:TraX family protein [Tissierellia bacterium]
MNRFQFKLFLAFFMVLDHIQPLVPDTVGLVFHVVSRFVAVGFAYLAVEGFFYTRDVKRYTIRLGAFGLAMALGNFILNLWLPKDGGIHNNILLSLALGTMLLWVFRDMKKPMYRTLSILGLFFLSFFTEGGPFILAFMLGTYIFWNDRRKMGIFYLVFSLVLFGLTLPYALETKHPIRTLGESPEFIFCIIFPILKLYNGKPGPKTPFTQYFFYIFYPLHLWIIKCIEIFFISKPS